MYRGDLKGADMRQYRAALHDHHSIHVRVQVLDMNHEPMSDLSEVLDDGQVNIINTAGEATRSATISFVDKGRTMDFDSDSPSDGALFANRLLRLEYRVKVEALGRWITVPVFTGPVTKLDRAGDYVNVEAQGKETLSLGGEFGAAWDPMTVKKHTLKVDAIRRIMRERGGESFFDLPDLHARLPKAVTLGRSSSPWHVAQRIAHSMDKQLYYTGSGRLRLRDQSENPVFTFSDGNGGEILTPPQVAFDITRVRNIVWVKGGKPRAKRRENETRAEFEQRQDKERGIRSHAVAPHSHPLSPWRLGTDEAPRYLLEEVENNHIRSHKEADRVAQGRLRRHLIQHLDITFDSLAIPHLDPGDMVAAEADGLHMIFRLHEASIPLKHDGVMSVGYTKKVSVSRRRHNRRGSKGGGRR